MKIRLKQRSGAARLKPFVNASLMLLAMTTFSGCGGGGGGGNPPPVTPPTDTTPPSVSISAPDAGATFTTARNVSISAIADDDTGISRIEFYRDGVLESTDDTASFSSRWAIDISDNGTYIWTARAYDAAGNETTSGPVSLTVDIAAGSATPDTNPPFNVSIDMPLDGTSYTSAGPVTVSATANDDVGVTKIEFYRDGVLRRTDTAAPWGWTTQLTAASNGAYSLTARAYDEYGNATTSDPVDVAVDIPDSGGAAPAGSAWLVSSDALSADGITDLLLTFDDNLNVVELSYSFNGTARIFTGAAINRSNADIDADGVVEVEADWGDDNGLTFAGELNGNRDVATGLLGYTIIDGDDVEVGIAVSATLIEQSNGGGTSDVTPPTVSISSPASGTIFSASATVDISATASDDVEVTKVEFYRSGVLRSVDLSAPYVWSPSLTAASNGTYSLTARALDAAGNAATSAPVNVTVNIPSGGGTPAPLAGTWSVDSFNLDFDQISDLKFTLDDTLVVTAISYRFGGKSFSFSGAQIDRGGADLDLNGDFDIEIDWDSDNALIFGGRLNGAQDRATGLIVYSIRDGFNVAISEGNATLIKQ